MTAHNGHGVLRSVVEHAREEAGCSLSELTALSAQNDPYRLDTPSGHRDGQWLAKHLDKAIGGQRRIHWRGLHYVLVSSKKPAVKPDGEVYRNTEEDWFWLINTAGKAARWLGYIPFERIRQALISFGDDWVAATRALIERKAYGKDGQ
jgi:hypothetical protein